MEYSSVFQVCPFRVVISADCGCQELVLMLATVSLSGFGVSWPGAETQLSLDIFDAGQNLAVLGVYCLRAILQHLVHPPSKEV